MSTVIVKDGESIDSALRRFKRNVAKAGIQQEIRSVSIMKSLVLNVKRNQWRKNTIKNKLLSHWISSWRGNKLWYNKSCVFTQYLQF